MFRNADDIRSIRETKTLAIIQRVARQDDSLEAIPFEIVVKIHNINQGQITAVDLPLSDKAIAARFHLITDQVKTVQDLADIYGLETGNLT